MSEEHLHELVHSIIRTQAVHGRMLRQLLAENKDKAAIAKLTAELDADAEAINAVVAAHPIPKT